jgi:hypothetical protein
VNFTVLLDAPDRPVSRIQIAKLGDFDDARYGTFSITKENVANWQRNLSKLPGGEALVDFEHRSERKPRDSTAAGWISGIDLDGDKVMASTRWTPRGKQAITDEEYRFISPVFGPSLGADNEMLDDALPSVALTNKPVLGMPAVMLASAERVSEMLDEEPAVRFYTRALDGELGDEAHALVMLDVSQAERDTAHAAGNSLPDKSYPINNVKQLKAAAILAASGHGNVAAAKKLIVKRAKELGVDVTTLAGFGSEASDSRRAMDAALLTALGIEDQDALKTLEAADLDESATKILLDAAASLKAKAEEHAPTEPLKTLEQQAKEDGKVLLDSAALTKLQLDAAAGAAAQKQLHAQTFETAFKTALDACKVAPAEKDSIAKVYELDSTLALKMLEDRTPIVNARPIGESARELDQDASDEQLQGAGVVPDSHRVNAAIRKHMLDNNLPESAYIRVLEQYQATGGRLS